MSKRLASKFGRSTLRGLDANIGRRNVYVAGYPISGNSWIAYMAAYVLNVRYWDIDATEWSAQRVLLRKHLTGENPHRGTDRFDTVLKTHESPLALPATGDDVIIYVVRDVRDVANSYFHRVERTWPGSPDWRRRLLIKVASRCLPLSLRYRMTVRRRAEAWADQVREVLEMADVTIVRYEDFLERPFECLEAVIRRIDPEAWHPEIGRAAVELFSFGNVTAAANASLSNASQRTDRVGGAGDWQNYFDRRDTDWFAERYDDLNAALASAIESVSPNEGRQPVAGDRSPE